MDKIIYIALEADILHPGNINIIKSGGELGELIVGLFTDEVIGKYKRVPLLDYHQRKTILSNLRNVKKIVPQNSISYKENLLLYKPDIVVHGDDWKEGSLKKIREEVITLLSQWGGELVEFEYTKGISTNSLVNELNKAGTTSEKRKKTLKQLIQYKPIVKILEVHNGLTGLIAEEMTVSDDNNEKQFDGMWLSSLTMSTSKGKPDTELVDFSSRFRSIEEILEVTTKPIIVDGDTGGSVHHFPYRIKTLERLGVSAIIIEDKVGLKRNSLFGTDVHQEQDSIANFCEKIINGNKVKIDKDFMIFARIESFILGKGLNDAIERAEAYVDAGADGIMIHSKESDGDEIKEFGKYFSKNIAGVPLIVVPSAFSHIKESELIDWGANIVIYANHLLRSAYPAMVSTARSILKNERSLEASNKYCMSIKEILRLIPEN